MFAHEMRPRIGNAEGPYPDVKNVKKRRQARSWLRPFPCLAAELILRLLSPADTPRLYTKVPSEMGWVGQPHARGLQAGIPVNANKQGEHIDQNRLIALQALQLAVS